MSGNHVAVSDDNTSETTPAVRPRLNASTSGRPKSPAAASPASPNVTHDMSTGPFSDFNSSTGNAFLTTASGISRISVSDDNSPRGSDDNVSRSSEPEPGALLDPYPAKETGMSMKLEQREESDIEADDEDEGKETLTKTERATTLIDLSSLPESSHDDDDEEYSVSWYQNKKHIFVFSEAGKPIYSRYGKEEAMVSLYGVMQALLSCVQDQDDDLKCIRTGDHLFVFRCHSPLILVAVSHLTDSEELLARQLHYLAKQTVFFLTQYYLVKAFKNRHNYDLRKQLGGLPKFFNGILNFTECEIGFLLGSVRCLPMPQSLRSEITNVLLTHRVPELVFAILLYDNQIVSALRPKQYILTAQDMHLLMNYVKTELNREQHGEKWAPCCLPDFNDGGFLYIHPSYISETTNLSLILITNEKEQHINMIQCKERIVSQLISNKSLDKLEQHILNSRFVACDTKIPHLSHFIYKSKSSKQLVMPEFVPPHTLDEERQRLFQIYSHVYDRLHHSYHKTMVYTCCNSTEVVVGYVSNNSEIYCVFQPMCTRPIALNNIDKLLRWIRKEENRFFILGNGVY